MYRPEPYRNAVKLQKVIMGRSQDSELDTRDLSSLARAYCELEEMQRKIAMRPLPKSIDVSKLGKGKRKQSGPSFQEPEPAKQAPEQGKSGTNSVTGQVKPTQSLGNQAK